MTTQKNDTPELPDSWKDVMREIAREVFSELAQMESSPTGTDANDEPPEPKTVKGGKGKPGRKEDRKYKKVSATIDEKLWKLFEKEQKRRKVSISRMFDIVLWQRYGKPALSFEKEKSK